MQENKTTLVVTAVPNPEEMAAVQEYLQGVVPLLAGAGGKVVKRMKQDRTIHAVRRNGPGHGLRLGRRDHLDVRVRQVPGARSGA